MAETSGHNLDWGTEKLIDKSQKELTPEQASLRLSRLLNSYTTKIDTLSQLKPEQKEKLKGDIKSFLLESLRNSLYEEAVINGKPKNAVGEYNVASVDTNREVGLDSYEFSRYTANLEEAMTLIIELGGVNGFKKEMGLLNKEAYGATTLKMDLFRDRDEKAPGTKKFTEWYLGTASNLTSEQIKDYTSTSFRGDKEKFIKGLCIAIGTELGPEIIETIVNFVYDLGKAIMQLPEYFYFGFQFNRATTEVGKKEYSLKMKSRLDDNMALGLLALVYDGTADVTQNLLGANISADAKGSRVKELIHNIGTPDTWTPAGIKDAIIGLLPFLKVAGKIPLRRSLGASGELGEVKRGGGGSNTERVQKPKDTSSAETNTDPPPSNTSKISDTPPLQSHQANRENTKNTSHSPKVQSIPSSSEHSKKQNQETLNIPDIAKFGVTEPITRSNNGEISSTNPKTASLDSKMNLPEEAIVKERKVNGETVKLNSEDYLKAYKEGLEKVGQLLSQTQDWVLMSSNAMYMNLKEYKMLPDDFDIVIRDKDFPSVYRKLFEAQKNGEIRDLEIHSIDDSYKTNIADTKIQETLFNAGNLKIVFNIDTATKIPMEVELFPEGKGKGLTQLGTIPRTIESFILNGREIKVSGVFDLSDTYTINLMNEILKNSVDQYGTKAKDGARVYNLTHYLQRTGINNPRDLLSKMDEVVGKYREHGGSDLAPGLEAIFARMPEVKEILGKIVESYEEKQGEFDGIRESGKLPEFQEFIETWNRNKGELSKLYSEISNEKPLSIERTKEIRGILSDYQWKTKEILDKSLNNADFAYFYEMSMIQMKFIERIRLRMTQNNQN